jgi:hypothetical protein
MAMNGSAGIKNGFDCIPKIYHMLLLIANLRPGFAAAMHARFRCQLPNHWIILRIFWLRMFLNLNFGQKRLYFKKKISLLSSQMKLEAISKMSFGPISLLVPRFKSSTYNSMPAV